MAIITDGMENASELYLRSEIYKTINERTAKDNWMFVFIGANQDAIAEGGKFGFYKERCLTMKASKLGVKYAFDSLIKQSKRMIVQDKYVPEFSKSDREKQKD